MTSEKVQSETVPPVRYPCIKLQSSVLVHMKKYSVSEDRQFFLFFFSKCFFSPPSLGFQMIVVCPRDWMAKSGTSTLHIISCVVKATVLVNGEGVFFFFFFLTAKNLKRKHIFSPPR